jgi:hypothetical protein
MSFGVIDRARKPPVIQESIERLFKFQHRLVKFERGWTSAPHSDHGWNQSGLRQRGGTVSLQRISWRLNLGKINSV